MISHWFVAASCCAGLVACGTRQEPPYVQDSAGDKPAATVELTPKGVGTPCVTIEVGETVEWRNLTPAIPANVTGFGNAELYSPSLVEGGPMGETIKSGQRVRFAWWRHRFAQPGVFEYFDTNRGDPGQKVVDPYYGTVRYVGVSSTLETGVVCVRRPGSTDCHAVCCLKNDDGSAVFALNECPESQCCDPKGKRCLLGSPNAPICQAGIGAVGEPAYREFACFGDAACPPTAEGKSQVCVTNSKDSHVCQPAP